MQALVHSTGLNGEAVTPGFEYLSSLVCRYIYNDTYIYVYIIYIMTAHRAIIVHRTTALLYNFLTVNDIL